MAAADHPGDARATSGALPLCAGPGQAAVAMGFPGRHAATILWVVASIGFTVYVANFNSYDKTYGSLGGVIILLTWLYLSALMVLFGAVINAQGLVSSGNPVPGRRGPDALARRSRPGPPCARPLPCPPASAQSSSPSLVVWWRSAARGNWHTSCSVPAASGSLARVAGWSIGVGVFEMAGVTSRSEPSRNQEGADLAARPCLSFLQ